tara:strand:- start:2294 stop:2695 length:402 start_codon:yes stop_codon:yes gene_type:complete
MAKKKTVKYWKTKIDKPFHEYIRRRDADNNSGYCKCVSCNKPIHFTESDAGHFIGRGALSTRWDEENVYAQCRKCNRFQYGRQYEYSLKLGSELAEKLLIKSKQALKLVDFEYMEIFETFRDKLAEIKKIQNF